MTHHSLSWFKKRTAAINKSLGTQYSPTALYKLQEKGYYTAEAQAFEMAPDPRSRSAVDAATFAAITLPITMSALIASNSTIFAIASHLNDGSYRKGNFIYVPLQNGGGYEVSPLTNPYKVTRVQRNPPAGGTLITSRSGYEMIKEKAKELHRYRERHPVESYEYI